MRDVLFCAVCSNDVSSIPSRKKNSKIKVNFDYNDYIDDNSLTELPLYNNDKMQTCKQKQQFYYHRFFQQFNKNNTTITKQFIKSIN